MCIRLNNLMQLNELLNYTKNLFSNRIRLLYNELANFRKNKFNELSFKEKISLNNLIKLINERIKEQNDKIKHLNDKINKIKNGLIDLMAYRVMNLFR
jgi:hypothetical protein